MRFLTDGMLGKLTRWLRLAGHDVVYVGGLEIPGGEQDLYLLERAKKERRILLTRDVELYRRAGKEGIRCLLIRGSNLPSQLREVFSECREKIEINPEKSRCPVCNGELKRKEREEIRDLLPQGVLKGKKTFWRCSECGKIYWRGRHWENILKTVKEIGG
jgi:uncharacterized protein with PIN domain